MSDLPVIIYTARDACRKHMHVGASAGFDLRMSSHILER